MTQRVSPGFTMIELLMVIILVGVLGAVALPQFLDFRQEAKVAVATVLAQSVATGIKLQHKQAILKCNMSPNTQIPLSSIEQNDITAGAGAVCTTAQIPNESNRKFFDGPIGLFPTNPVTGLRTIGLPAALNPGERYSENGTCSASDVGTTYGWCYDPTAGDFFSADDETGGGTVIENSSSSSISSSSSVSSFTGCNPGGRMYTCQDQGVGGGIWDNSACTCICPFGTTYDNYACY